MEKNLNTKCQDALNIEIASASFCGLKELLSSHLVYLLLMELRNVRDKLPARRKPFLSCKLFIHERRP